MALRPPPRTFLVGCYKLHIAFPAFVAYAFRMPWVASWLTERTDTLWKEHPMNGVCLSFGTQANFEKYRAPYLLYLSGAALRKGHSLILIGYSYFGDDTVRLHKLLLQMGIPHVYANSREARPLVERKLAGSRAQSTSEHLNPSRPSMTLAKRTSGDISDAKGTIALHRVRWCSGRQVVDSDRPGTQRAPTFCFRLHQHLVEVR